MPMNPGRFPKKRPASEVFDPTFTPPALSGDTAFFRKPKMAAGRARKKEIPEGLWTKCPRCASMIFDRELDENLKVCARCQHHFPIGSRERIHALVETCSFRSQTANAVTSSGDTKLMALTSASGRKLIAPKLHSVDPSISVARASWPVGCTVRTRSRRIRGRKMMIISPTWTAYRAQTTIGTG